MGGSGNPGSKCFCYELCGPLAAVAIDIIVMCDVAADRVALDAVDVCTIDVLDVAMWASAVITEIFLKRFSAFTVVIISRR